MTRGLVGRVGQYALVLVVAASLNFLLPRLAPGDPVTYLYGGASGALTETQLDQLRAAYHLDGSLAEQYLGYWRGLAQGELGLSVSRNRPVTAVLAEHLPWTVLLVGTASILTVLVGTLAGAVAAWRRGRRRDVGLVAGLLALDAMPGFWIGMILIAVFAVQLGWFPSFGAAPIVGAEGLAWVAEVAHRTILPVLTIMLATLGTTFLLARGSMLSALGQPYVRLAEAKGVPHRGVAYRHALRNALLPVYTRFMLNLGVLVSGAVVVETVFAYPGLGRLIYEAVLARDYPLLQGAFLLVTVGVVGANLLADLTYPLLDPRVRRPGPAQPQTPPDREPGATRGDPR